MRLLFGLIIMISLFSCNTQNKIPDVSNIKVELNTRRFEQQFFALDTGNIMPQLDQLIAAYPSFGENFMGTILGIDPQWSADTTATYIKQFLPHSSVIESLIAASEGTSGSSNSLTTSFLSSSISGFIR